MLIDSHCHLDYPSLTQDRGGVLARARAAQVVRMVNIGTTKREFPAIRATAEAVDEVFCSFGVHPHHVADGGEKVSAEDIISFAHHPKVVGIGETGLDFFYEKAPRDLQETSFREHIRAAQQTKLPLIVHSRDAEDDTIRVLRSEGHVTGVMHCFSSRRVLAEEAIKIGFYVSLSGILTFKKSEELRSIVHDVPLNRLLVETDSPYLAPIPHRGKPCEPAFVVETARVLADIKGVSFEDISRITTENFFRLFTQVSALP